MFKQICIHIADYMSHCVNKYRSICIAPKRIKNCTPLYEYNFEYPMVKWSIPLVKIPARYYNWYMMRKNSVPPQILAHILYAQLKVYKNSTAAH